MIGRKQARLILSTGWLLRVIRGPGWCTSPKSGKGIRLLNQLFDGDHTRTEALIEAISAALDLPDSVVDRAAQVSQRLLAERQRRHFELQETTGHADKSTGSVVPYLRLISD